MRVTWRRRALRALQAVGADAATPGPASVVLGRRGAVTVEKIAPGAVLVGARGAHGRDWLAAENGLARLAARRHVAALLEMYRVNCVLDVGANRGQFAAGLRAAGFDGHIVSFEPVPETFAALARAAAGDERWTAHPYALGREDGTVAMNVVPGTLSSALPATAFGARRYARLREPETVEVPVRRLDGVLDEVLAGVRHPRPYLKLDTQGFDLEAFAGLGERARDVVAMQSELALMTIYDGMPRLPEALAAYEGAGFEVTGLYPVSREARTARVLEFDCVMVRPAAL
jgi:FkbM family methyltransferase